MGLGAETNQESSFLTKIKKIFHIKNNRSRDIHTLLTVTEQDIINAQERMRNGKQSVIEISLTEEEINDAFKRACGDRNIVEGSSRPQ